MRYHFQVYGADLHPAAISSKHGRYDEEGNKCEKSESLDEQESRLFGFLYNTYEDSVKVPIRRKLNYKKRGIRVSTDLKPAEVSELKVTMRMLKSFQMSLFDNCGFLSILTVRGKQLLSRVQALLSPAEAGNWDKVLPDTDNLLQDARDYIHMIITTVDVVFPRSPPEGVLRELQIHVDGSTHCYAAAAWGVWTTPSGERDSKLLFAKTKIGKQTVARNEMSAMNLGCQIAANMVKIYSSIQTVCVFGDSEAVNLQIKATYKPRDVFRSNKYNSIQANIEDMQESGIQVEVFLVRSADNQADPVSKFQENSKELIKSDKWLRGVEWMRKERNIWPVVDVNVQPRKDEKAKSCEKDEEMNTCQNQVPTTLLAAQAQPVKKPKSSEKHIFTGTIERCSRVDVAIRAVARVKSIFKNKSFKVKNPSFEDEDDAFSTLVRMEQKVMRPPPKNLLVKEVAGLRVTSQRWSPQEHLDLFGVPHLPLLPVEDRLGHLLLRRAHRPPQGPCAGDRHTLQRLRILKYQVFLFGPVHPILRKIRSGCVSCLK